MLSIRFLEYQIFIEVYAIWDTAGEFPDEKSGVQLLYLEKHSMRQRSNARQDIGQEQAGQSGSTHVVSGTHVK